MDLTFREAILGVKADEKAVVDLLNGFSLVSENRDLPKEVKNTLIENLKEFGNAKIYFVEDGGQAIGIANCVISFSSFYAKKVLNIHDFFIDTAYHRKGVGSSLMDYVLSEAKKGPYCKVTLEVLEDNPPAQRLYEKHGFFGNGTNALEDTKYFMTRRF